MSATLVGFSHARSHMCIGLKYRRICQHVGCRKKRKTGVVFQVQMSITQVLFSLFRYGFLQQFLHFILHLCNLIVALQICVYDEKIAASVSTNVAETKSAEHANQYTISEVQTSITYVLFGLFQQGFLHLLFRFKLYLHNLITTLQMCVQVENTAASVSTIVVENNAKQGSSTPKFKRQ